jgi:hypothetical protein
VEVLVVIAIITMLVALLVPAINAARESARSAVCQSNLRQFALGLMAHAEKHQDQLCSGAFSWKDEGCVTEVGWVADLVNSGIPVGQMLCPSNPARISEVYNELLTLAAVDPCVDRLGGPPVKLPDGSIKENACRLLAAAADKALVIREQIYDKHYNTNYVATWFLTRAEVQTESSGNLKFKAGCPASLKSRASTVGPLTRARLDAAKISANFIPLLGDARATGILSQTIGPIEMGTLVVDSLTNGPLDPATMLAPTFAAGTSYEGPSGWWAGWSAALQDYRGFGPVHRGVCNVVFADASVKSIRDRDGDGLLNSGFTPNATNGFGSSTVELPGNEFAIRWSLKEAQP